jgi:hypothetical protein
MMTTESVGSAEVVETIGSSKSVQQLALNSDQNLPNSNYIYKEGGVGFRDALLPLESIPVVDIGNLGSPSTAQQELLKLHSALSSWGFFQVNFHYLFMYSNLENNIIKCPLCTLDTLVLP